jgi:hypothetical protein
MLALVYLEMVLILMQDKCTVCTKRSVGLENRFGCTRWISYGTLVMWNLVLIHLETMVVSVQDRCTVCVERTIGSEIMLDGPDCAPR